MKYLTRVGAALALLGLGAIIGLPATEAGKPIPPNTECAGTTLTGTYKHIQVPDGASCTLDGALVLGNITVGEGATFIAKFTDVGGNINATDAASVRIVGDETTHLASNIFATGTTGNVVIGSVGCTIDPPVAHNVMVSETQGSVAICFVSTMNNIKVTDNHGPIGLFDNDAGTNLQVIGNVITNDMGLPRPAIRLRNNVAGVNIDCRDNDPAPKGYGNTAKRLTGQCEFLG